MLGPNKPSHEHDEAELGTLPHSIQDQEAIFLISIPLQTISTKLPKHQMEPAVPEARYNACCKCHDLVVKHALGSPRCPTLMCLAKSLHVEIRNEYFLLECPTDPTDMPLRVCDTTLRGELTESLLRVACAGLQAGLLSQTWLSKA